MRYRVEQLAARCDISVDTVRYYQTRGLLPRPEREGRVAIYDDTHATVLERIRDLKERGFTLAMIARVLAGELDASEQALAGALAGPLPGEDSRRSDERLGIRDLAERTGMSLTVLQALERDGLLVPRSDDERPYTLEDVRIVRAGLILLDEGVPLSELLALARQHDEAMRDIAARAVDLFARYVRDPIRSTAHSDDEASARMVDALTRMLPAVTDIIDHHFRRRLLLAAAERLAPTPAAPHAADGHQASDG